MQQDQAVAHSKQSETKPISTAASPAPMYTGDIYERQRRVGGSKTPTMITAVIAVVGFVTLAIGVPLTAVGSTRLKEANRKLEDAKKTTVRTFQILHYNDNYQVDEYNVTVNKIKIRTGGLSRLMTVKKRNPDALVVFSGDTLFPSAMSTVFKGEQMIDTMNFLGVDVATIGNHEFDKGMDNWATMRDKSNFTWIIANFVDKGMGASGSFSKLKKNMIIRRNGLDIGFFGLASDWRSMTSVDAEFFDIVATAKQQVAELQQRGAEFIVAVTHNNQVDDELMAANVTGIDLILGGHDHNLVTRVQVNNVIVWKSQSDLVHAGLFNISVLRDSQNTTFSKIIPITLNLNEADGVTEDPSMKQRVLSWVNRLSNSSAYVGTVVQELSTQDVRTKETSSGNYLADALVWEVQTKRAADLSRNPNTRVVGICNSGFIRGPNVDVGNFTTVRMLGLLPFDNIACCLQITGDILRQAIENGIRDYPTEAGKFPQVSGFSYSFDSNKPAGSRLLSLKYTDGTPVQSNDIIYAGMTDYMFKEGDDYTWRKWGTVTEIIKPNEGRDMRECVTDFTRIKLNYIIDYTTYGRIQHQSSKLSVLEEVLDRYSFEDVMTIARKLEASRHRRPTF